jgi:hypothetical protein
MVSRPELGCLELQFCESAAEIRANPNAIATLGIIAELATAANELASTVMNHHSTNLSSLSLLCNIILSRLLS